MVVSVRDRLDDLEAKYQEPTAEEAREFEDVFRDSSEREMAMPAPGVVWSPQRGSQTEFLQCPLFECLIHGTRGGGKTDALGFTYAQYVGRGFGEDWRGILFRKTYPQLGDVVAKTHKWFPRVFPGARFNWARMCWVFPTGEVLAFRHMAKPEDYWNYHGHEYPWIGFEELTAWSDERCYTSMFSCCRSGRAGMPRMIRSTTNPYGPGLGWVKARFELAGQWWLTVIVEKPVDRFGNVERPRVAIHSHIDENKVLLAADPHYKSSVTSSATSEAMALAWLHGSWDITAGGMFDDVWNPRYNLLPPFEVPKPWRIDRAFDWGSSKPFSVGWYAQSDGSDLMFPSGRVLATVRGDLYRIREWYGWNGHPNEGLRKLAVDVAEGIVEREIMWNWRPNPSTNRVSEGPADTSIFKVENGVSIALDMQKPVRVNGNVYPGVVWLEADKRPGSRKSGWEMIRKMMRAAAPPKPGLPRESPGFFVVGERNQQFLRTVLSLPRDEDDMDDVDTDAEDHIGDEVRYRVRAAGNYASEGSTSGYY